MPDTLEATPSTPEVPTTEVPSTQDINRQALYEQYYGTQDGGIPPPADTAPPADSVAQTEQVEAPVTPAATLPPEALSLLQTMQQELVDLRAKVNPPAPVAPPVPGTAPEEMFISLLKEGKVKEAIAVLAGAVADLNKTQLTQDTLQQTRETMRAEAEVDRFTTDLRASNPELVPMERLIAAEAQDRMAQARAAGQIKTTDDAVRIYKSAVTEAVTSARKLYHTLRGDGKSEAQVRQREVLSSRPIPPQSTDTARPQVNGQDAVEPPTESATEYLAKRDAVNNWKKGLAPKPNFI